MLIRFHPKKVFKFVPFPNQFIINHIRRIVWDVRDKVLEEENLESELGTLKEKIIMVRASLKRIIEGEVKPDTINQVKELRERLSSLVVVFREKSKAIIDAFIKEIEGFEGIDDRAEVLAFREVKDIKKAEQEIIDMLSKLRETALKGLSVNQKAEAAAKIDAAITTVKIKAGQLHESINTILGFLYDYAKRERIEGIVKAAVVTKGKPVLLKGVKTKTKAAGSLIAQQKGIMKKVKKSRNLDDFMRNITALFDLYIEEARDLKKAVENNRIFTYDLTKDLHRVEEIIGAIDKESNKEPLSEADKSLKNALDHIEEQYRLLFRESKMRLAA